MSDRQRYVLCIPRMCGLNDVLVQIWHSYLYAVRDGRHLVIDTRISGLWDNLDSYLVPNDPRLITARVDDQVTSRLDSASCWPSMLEGRITLLHRSVLIRQRGAATGGRAARMRQYARDSFDPTPGRDYADRGAWATLSFGLRTWGERSALWTESPRPEDVVVHHRSGGGIESLFGISLFRFTAEVRNAVLETRERLGDDYVALHVRNTDLQTDLVSAFEMARVRYSGRRVLVCSDDTTVIEQARVALPDCEILTASPVEDSKGRALHHVGAFRNPAERRRMGIAMFVDLICLAMAQDLVFASTTAGRESGYSLLAQSLHRHPEVVAALLAAE